MSYCVLGGLECCFRGLAFGVLVFVLIWIVWFCVALLDGGFRFRLVFGWILYGWVSFRWFPLVCILC